MAMHFILSQQTISQCNQPAVLFSVLLRLRFCCIALLEFGLVSMPVSLSRARSVPTSDIPYAFVKLCALCRGPYMGPDSHESQSRARQVQVSLSLSVNSVSDTGIVSRVERSVAWCRVRCDVCAVRGVG